MWIWSPDWWNTLEGILAALDPLTQLLEQVQSDSMTLGRAVEMVLPILDGIPRDVKNFAPGDVTAATKRIAERRLLLVHHEAVMANSFNHRYRGRKIPEEDRSAL